MSTTKDAPKVLTTPDKGLSWVAPGIYVSKTSIRDILEELKREGKLEESGKPRGF